MLETFQNFFAPPRHMILLVIAAWLGLTLAERRAENHGISKDDLNNITFYGLIAFVIGGRISYVLQNLSAFSKSPLGILSINPDLFDPLGALAAACIVALVYGQRKQLTLWNTLDALTPFLAVFAIGSGLSHLAAGTAFGQPTELPWGIEMWNATRHPTQMYETLASLLTLGLILLFKPHQRPGFLFLIFTAQASFWQLVIHAFRADSTMIVNGLRQEQILAWVVLAFSFICLELIDPRPPMKKLIDSKYKGPG
ncbi:MAG: prolipoprotein diacylglyceryl transferase [Anaerolineales bacterium]|nr:prolipoprotein diacylglyceryl transferase [Anaerolineales bacterium]